jgi:hypothetical protein
VLAVVVMHVEQTPQHAGATSNHRERNGNSLIKRSRIIAPSVYARRARPGAGISRRGAA